MPRRLLFLRPCLGLGTALLLTAAAPLVLSLDTHPALAQAAGDTRRETALSVDQARAAAVRILEAVKRRDAQARYEQFTPEMQAVTSPSMIAATMRSTPKILSYKLLSVRSGLSSSTVEADLITTAGQRTIFIVLNGKGQIVRYYIDREDDPSSKVAQQFMQAISSGHFITAHSFLSPEVQKEITARALQDKWFNLQRETGSFVKLGRAVEADNSEDARLVLVNVSFNRLTENVYVILNQANQIIGLDFPETAISPASIR